jgi:hypothetical protein
MADTVTFEKDGFRFTIKSEFVKRVPNYLELEVINLLQDQQMGKSLHNPVGPALVALTPLKDGTIHEQYWLDGKRLDEETAKKIQHNMNFNNNFIESINSDT